MIDSSSSTAPADWPEVLVIASSTSWDDTRLSEKQLALALSALAPVLFVDPPISFLTPLRKPALRESLREPQLRLVQPQLARLTPRTVPGISRPVLRQIGEWLSRRAIRSAVTKLGGHPKAIIAASLDPVFDACPGAVRVVYGTDDWSSAGALMGVSESWLARRESRQLAESDVIVAVSEQLASRWRSQGHDVAVVPNGCDTRHFATTDEGVAAPEVTLPQPIAGFIGHLSERIELESLERIAANGTSLLLVGPRQLTFNIERMAALLRLPNVQWVGSQPFERLPEFMRHITVGLTPYADSPFNRSSDPLKTLEYLAAGRAVVVSDLPSAHLFAPGLVQIASSPHEFAERVHALLTTEPDASAAHTRRTYAQGHSWDARAAEVLAAIRDASAGTQSQLEPGNARNARNARNEASER